MGRTRALLIAVPGLVTGPRPAASQASRYTPASAAGVVTLTDTRTGTVVRVLVSGSNAYQMTVNGQDVIRRTWLTLDDIRGRMGLNGVPLLWPYANRLDEQAFYFNGQEYRSLRSARSVVPMLVSPSLLQRQVVDPVSASSAAQLVRIGGPMFETLQWKGIDMRKTQMLLAMCGVALVAFLVVASAEPQIQVQTPPMPELPNKGLGETDTPLIPGQPWRSRDLKRPKPVTVTPARHAGDPPSDAIVLFDGKDLSQWTVGGGGGRGRAAGPAGAAAATAAPQPSAAPVSAGWKVANGYMEVTPDGGSLTSKERFRDFQLHLEFAAPPVPVGYSQYRGNSGITLGGREIQILDNYDNPTYADGYVGAIYGQWPPLANPSRPPGEWQTLDIAYFAARYDGDTLVRNPFVTVFMNGVLIHANREIQPNARGGGAGRAGAPGAGAPGAGAGRGPAIPAGGDQPVGLMGHPSAIPGNAVRYRNIWVRRVAPELPTSPARVQ